MPRRRRNHPGKEYKQMIQPDAKEKKPSREGVQADDTARGQGDETIQGRSISRRYSQRPRRRNHPREGV